MPTPVPGTRAGGVEIPGLPRLIRDRLGNPPVVRWVSISPAGTIRVHESENRIGYVRNEQRSVQWRLILDIAALIDPAGLRDPDDLYAAWRITDADELGGMLIEPWLPCHTSQPPNQTAARMMQHVNGWGLQVWGTVLFLGYANDRGVHISVTDDQVAALLCMAAETQRGNRLLVAS